jgi:hypothetical protein
VIARPPTFRDVDFGSKGNSTTAAVTHTPQYVHEQDYCSSSSVGNLYHTSSGSPDALLKRTRFKEAPDYALNGRSASPPGSVRSGRSCTGLDDLPTMGIYKTASFTERGSFSSSNTSRTSSVAHPLAPISSFRPTEATAQGTVPPKKVKLETPLRQIPFDGSNSVVTSPALPDPTPIQPFQHLDNDRLIFINKHREDWEDYALCLDCFQRHQNFHRVLKHGCEVCGKDDILESKYWETPGRI